MHVESYVGRHFASPQSHSSPPACCTALIFSIPMPPITNAGICKLRDTSVTTCRRLEIRKPVAQDVRKRRVSQVAQRLANSATTNLGCDGESSPKRSRSKGYSKMLEEGTTLWRRLVHFPVRRSTSTRTHATLTGKAEQEVTNPKTMSCVPFSFPKKIENTSNQKHRDSHCDAARTPLAQFHVVFSMPSYVCESCVARDQTTQPDKGDAVWTRRVS